MLFKKQSAFFLAVLTAVMSLGITGCKEDDSGWNGSISTKGENSETVSTETKTETVKETETEAETEAVKETETETEPTVTEPRYFTFTADEASSLIMQSLTLAVNMNDVDTEDYLEDENILKEMGWCQALIQRMFDRDYLTETEALAYQAAIGGNPDVLVEIPAEWKDEELCVFGTDENGEWTVSFPQHYAYLDEALGISMAFETEPCDDGSIESRILYYMDDGESFSFVTCYFIFEETDGIFPCKIREFKTVSGFEGLDINGEIWGGGDILDGGDEWDGGGVTGNALCDLSIIGGSLGYVIEQNLLGNYFESADSVTVHGIYPGYETEFYTEYFIRNDRYAAIDSYVGENGEKQVSSWSIPNMTFWNDDESHILGNVDFRGYIEGSGMEMESEIADYFLYDGEISSCIDLGETVKLTVENCFLDEYYGWDVYILDKGTLHLIKADSFDLYGNLICTVEVTTGGEVDYKETFSAWDSTRTVTFVYNELQMDESIFTTELTVEVPDTCEMLPVLEESVNLYMDEGYTVPYEYPGAGGDYTVYMTNIAG